MNNKFDSFDRAKVGYDKMAAYDKKIWNAAIEAAAKLMETDNRNGVYNDADQIRKLKK